jgi:monoamine oxidase
VMDKYYSDYTSLLKKINSKSNASKSIKTVIQEIDKQLLIDLKMQYQLSSYMEFDTGGDIADLSSTNWESDENFAGEDVLFPNGYDEIVNFLAKNQKIELNTIVEKIDYTGTEIKITTNNGMKTAQKIICTIPLGVLQSGKVNFTPILPNTFSDAIARLKMGNVNKIALLFDQCFWDKDVQYVGYTSQEKGAFSYILNVKKFLPNVNMLMSFGFGNFGKTIDNQSVVKTKDDFLTVLKKIYGEKNVPNPSQVLVSQWGNEEFSKGSYSFANVGSSDEDFLAFEKDLDKKIFFAGEHTSRDYRGTVHGAFLSGEKAVETLLKNI